MALTQVDQGLLSTNAQYTGFKNRIINGAMVIDQRNAGASVTGNGVYTLDRWYAQATINSKYTVQQNAGSVTPPAGFANYLGVTSSSAYTVGASENFSLLQAIEGYNMADFAWGTASASSITLSFRVYSSLTGTFGGSLQNSAQNRSYPFTYTISSANTWTTISITIAGETTGTWLKTNGAGIYMWIGLGVGSTYSGTAGAWASSNYSGATGATSVVGTNGATFYITGVQLEKGSTATSFDYRPYGTELQLCQRYFETSYDYGTAVGTVTNAGCIAVICYNTSANRPFLNCPFKVTKRTTPTVTPYNPYTGGSGTMNGPSNTSINSTVYYAGTQATNFYAAVGAGVSNGDYYQQWIASAEL
jgi:hypothetical protein